MTAGEHESPRPGGLLLTRSFIADYVRNPVNLVVLVLVPLVFVVVAARSLADAMELLGGKIGPALETVTAGWAAGFLSSLAMYFQVRSARAADRRMLIAGLPPVRLIAARAGTGLLLAGLVSAVALIALALRTGIEDPGRVVVGTLMFALIYLAIGAVVGVVIANPVNGAVVIFLLIWMVDVFFGPGGSGGDKPVSRFFSNAFRHIVDGGSAFASWRTTRRSGHRSGWVIGAGGVVCAGVLAASSRTGGRSRPASSQFTTALRLGLVDLRRNPVLLVLLVVVPAVFVLLAKATTPARTLIVAVTDNGISSSRSFWFPPEVHAGTMAPPIAVGGALAALAGMFVVVDTAEGDRRLRVAGYRTGVAVAARLSVVAAAVMVICAATLAVTATVFNARQWVGFCRSQPGGARDDLRLDRCDHRPAGRPGCRRLYRVSCSLLDLGIAQSPMLRPHPSGVGTGVARIRLDQGVVRHRLDTALRPDRAAARGGAWVAGGDPDSGGGTGAVSWSSQVIVDRRPARYTAAQHSSASFRRRLGKCSPDRSAPTRWGRAAAHDVESCIFRHFESFSAPCN